MLDKLFYGIDVHYGSFDAFLETEVGGRPAEIAILHQKFTRPEYH